VVLWLVLFRRSNRLKVEFNYIGVFLLVFVCTPIMFVPVHYLLTGYLTGVGNIMAIAAYQFPMNVFALAIAAAILRRMESAPKRALLSETK